MSNIRTILYGALLLANATTVAGADVPLAVERLSSCAFVIGFVQVDPDAATASLTVRGTVRPRMPERGAIPGQMRITVLDGAGCVLATTDTGLMRRNRQAPAARFHARLAVLPPPGSRVRVEHQLADGEAAGSAHNCP